MKRDNAQGFEWSANMLARMDVAPRAPGLGASSERMDPVIRGGPPDRDFGVAADLDAHGAAVARSVPRILMDAPSPAQKLPEYNKS
eukprot:10622558-Karenia_brevis.AAC.1